MLTERSNVTIKNLSISKFSEGVFLNSTFQTIIENNTIQTESSGVKLVSSSSNTISANNITENDSAGVLLISSSFNGILRNIIMKNTCGVRLENSSNSNTISQNKIAGGNIAGIDLCSFDLFQEHNRIFGNEIRSNRYGVHFLLAFNGTIRGNNMEDNAKGLVIYRSRNTTITENTMIRNTDQGIYLDMSYDGRVYHNNFIDNGLAPFLYSSSTTWDSGYPSGGNYWSDYNGTDLFSNPHQNENGNDGIGDSSYGVNSSPHTPPELVQFDNYPLMGTFHSFNTFLGKPVNIVSNSSLRDFECEPTGVIRFYVSNFTDNQTFGFCRVTIPHDVLSPPYNVTVNGANPIYWNYTLYDNGTHTWIYFEYEHSTLEVVIIPECPSFLIPPLFMIATLLIVMLYRKQPHFRILKNKA
jgi:parallel beta-helix repeat protein